MSKEMMVIVFGLFIIMIRTLLGVPGNWQTFLFIVTGVALMVVGFLLRGEALSRSISLRQEHGARGDAYPFVESASAAHEHKEGITSLN